MSKMKRQYYVGRCRGGKNYTRALLCSMAIAAGMHVVEIKADGTRVEHNAKPAPPPPKIWIDEEPGR